jgi:hypothetical protein
VFHDVFMSGGPVRATGELRAARWLRSPAFPALLAIGAFVAVRSLVLAALVVTAEHEGRSGWRLLMKWDAQWYAGIAEQGYGFVRLHEGRRLADYAFFPGLPWAERLVAAVTGLRPVEAGLVVSAVASVVAAAGIFAVASRVFDTRVGVVATVLWAALPVGIVQSMAYSESLFTAAAAWSLYAVLAQRWLVAGVLACAAGLTRPAGLAVVAAVVMAAGVDSAWLVRAGRASRDHRALSRRLTAAAIAPLGLLGYLTWVAWQVESPTGYFEVANAWGNGFDGGVAFAAWTGQLLAGSTPVAGASVVIGVALLACLLYLCFKQGQPLPLIVFVSVLAAMALTTSGFFGSKPRYLLPAFPLLFPPAAWLAQRRTRVCVSLLAGLAVLAAAYGAVWLLGSGPP